MQCIQSCKLISVRDLAINSSTIRTGTVHLPCSLRKTNDTTSPKKSICHFAFQLSLSFKKRYLTTAPKKNDGHEYKWWVPITFTQPGTAFDNTYSDVWIRPEDTSVRVEGLPAADVPAIFNVQERIHESRFFKFNEILSKISQNWTQIQSKF